MLGSPKWRYASSMILAHLPERIWGAGPVRIVRAPRTGICATRSAGIGIGVSCGRIDGVMVKEDTVMPAVPVLARKLRLVDGNGRDDEAAIPAHRPKDAADLRAMPRQKVRKQP